MWPIAIANSTFGGHTHTSCLFGCLTAFEGNKNSKHHHRQSYFFGGSKVMFFFCCSWSQAICTPSTSIPWMPTSWQLDMWKSAEKSWKGQKEKTTVNHIGEELCVYYVII